MNITRKIHKSLIVHSGTAPIVYVKNRFWLIASFLFCIMILTGCKNKPATAPQYQSKYREAQLVGEWVYQETKLLTKQGSYELDVVSFVEDTLIFDYNGNVMSKCKYTNHYQTFHPEEQWGEYKSAKGTYKMENDSLLISLDWSNVLRANFGKDPLSPFPAVNIKQDRLDNYYVVSDLRENVLTIIQYLRKWEGGYVTIDNIEYRYIRR